MPHAACVNVFRSRQRSVIMAPLVHVTDVYWRCICVSVGCLQRFLKYGTALAAKTEYDFNSVERVVQYLTPETEAAEETVPEVAAQLPKDWPASKQGAAVCDLSIHLFVPATGGCCGGTARCRLRV